MPLPEKLRAHLCLGALLAITAGPTAAGPPFVTDDPEPVPFRHWEVYIASQQSNDRDGISGTAPHVEVNYGPAPNLQVHLIAPLAYAGPRGGPTLYGYGDTELGAKWRFLQETGSRPQIGIFPLIEVPTGSARRGLGSGTLQAFLPVWLQKNWGPWTTYGGGGYNVNPGAGNKNWWLAGWLIQRDLSKSLTIGAEAVYTTADTAGGSDALGYRVGAIVNFDDVHHILFSAGRAGGPNLYSGYLAYQWTFGPRNAGR